MKKRAKFNKEEMLEIREAFSYGGLTFYFEDGEQSFCQYFDKKYFTDAFLKDVVCISRGSSYWYL